MTDAPDTIRSGPGGSAPEAYCPACGQSFPPATELCPVDGARLIRITEKVDPLIGRVFERRYEIRARLGEGGMGTVYRGWQLSVDREVAIKVIDPKLSTNRGVVKRFLREARLSSRLNQPSIVNVYDFGQTEDGILYIVMELLRGHTLGRELDGQAFSVERALHIAVQLCDALDAAHAQEIIHRDLKPGNIVILDEPPGRDLVKVLDFGLAKSLAGDAMSKVTHTDAMLGTPLYMAPEQISGTGGDRRSDLYSLGCILHEMVSGTSPFADTTVNRVLSNHLYELAKPLPSQLSPSLADVIVRLLAKHPEERYQSAGEVRAALLAELGHASTLDVRLLAERPPTVAGTRARPPVATPVPVDPSVGTSAVPARGRRWWLGLVALVASGALVTALAISMKRTPRGTAGAGDAGPSAEPGAAGGASGSSAPSGSKASGGFTGSSAGGSKGSSAGGSKASGGGGSNAGGAKASGGPSGSIGGAPKASSGGGSNAGGVKASGGGTSKAGGAKTSGGGTSKEGGGKTLGGGPTKAGGGSQTPGEPGSTGSTTGSSAPPIDAGIDAAPRPAIDAPELDFYKRDAMP